MNTVHTASAVLLTGYLLDRDLAGNGSASRTKMDKLVSARPAAYWVPLCQCTCWHACCYNYGPPACGPPPLGPPLKLAAHHHFALTVKALPLLRGLLVAPVPIALSMPVLESPLASTRRSLFLANPLIYPQTLLSSSSLS